jgi:hypothetical protein
VSLLQLAGHGRELVRGLERLRQLLAELAVALPRGALRLQAIDAAQLGLVASGERVAAADERRHLPLDDGGRRLRPLGDRRLCRRRGRGHREHEQDHPPTHGP